MNLAPSQNTQTSPRYPIHYHYVQDDSTARGMVADCSIRHSFYRAVVIHHTNHILVTRNTAFDVTGHAFYLEAGTEENNLIEHNLASFVHPIGGPVIMISSTVDDLEQTEHVAVPADHAASGFYISNVHNTITGNAASGGWAGFNLPTFPEV